MESPDSKKIELVGHPRVEVKIAVVHRNATIPQYATDGSSGFDLMACFDDPDHIIHLLAGDSTLIDTGLKFEIPFGYELQIRSRSGLALKNGLIVLNSPGTVDADYRSGIGVILKNASPHYAFVIKHGMKIAQGVICPVVQANFIEVKEEELSKTGRGAGGFGSTGL